MWHVCLSCNNTGQVWKWWPWPTFQGHRRPFCVLHLFVIPDHSYGWIPFKFIFHITFNRLCDIYSGFSSFFIFSLKQIIFVISSCSKSLVVSDHLKANTSLQTAVTIHACFLEQSGRRGVLQFLNASFNLCGILFWQRGKEQLVQWWWFIYLFLACYRTL